jgi:hypothetical protein
MMDSSGVSGAAVAVGGAGVAVGGIGVVVGDTAVAVGGTGGGVGGAAGAQALAMSRKMTTTNSFEGSPFMFHFLMSLNGKSHLKYTDSQKRDASGCLSPVGYCPNAIGWPTLMSFAMPA